MQILGELQIRGLELQTNLGWRDKELLTPQAIVLDFDILYKNAPAAITTDNLNDTLCYAELIEQIRAKIAAKKYRLIEHLCHDVFQIILSHLSAGAFLRVSVTKKPKIDGLNGGVTFSCSTQVA